MAFPTVKEVLQDPEFISLPSSEKRKVLSEIDSEFRRLPEDEQIKVSDMLSPVPRIEGDDAIAPSPSPIQGMIIDPVTGQPSQQQIEGLRQEALAEARGRGAQAQRAISRSERIAGSNPIESAVAGAASLPASVAQIISSLGGSRLQAARPQDAAMIQEIQETAAANPIAATAGAIAPQLATMGTPAAAVNLLRTQGLGAAARSLAPVAGVNVVIGEGIRRATGSETTPIDVALDLISSSMGGRAPAAIPKRVVQTAEEITSEPALANVLRQLEPRATPASEYRLRTTPSEIPITSSQPSPATSEGVISSAMRTVGAERMADRRNINLAARRESQQQINQLADEAARTLTSEGVNATPIRANFIEAANNDINPQHLSSFVNANPIEREIGLKMLNEARDIASGSSRRDPSLTVGNEFIKRLEAVESLASRIGSEQNQIVRQLPSTPLQSQEDILSAIRSVPGMEELRVSPNGDLDFADTTLSTSGTKSERKQIQGFFKDFQGKSALQTHRIRQELFEIIGGKKSARIEMTDTLEKVLEAMRSGAGDAIDRISPEYMAANRRYARVVQPLKEMRRYFKNVEGAGQDILDAKGALLARRFTNNMNSGPDLRRIVGDMESQLVENNIPVETSIGNLQDMLNSIANYYDIAKGTSLEGIVRRSIRVEVPEQGIIRPLLKAGARRISESTEITPEVRQQKLRKFVESLPRSSQP